MFKSLDYKRMAGFRKSLQGASVKKTDTFARRTFRRGGRSVASAGKIVDTLITVTHIAGRPARP
ncbi:MAG: hypothetical protein IAE88_10370 [Rhodobacteraceae bacterium]|nr:hypothetical protein [Paracoccaceae bacterium]